MQTHVRPRNVVGCQSTYIHISGKIRSRETTRKLRGGGKEGFLEQLQEPSQISLSVFSFSYPFSYDSLSIFRYTPTDSPNLLFIFIVATTQLPPPLRHPLPPRRASTEHHAEAPLSLSMVLLLPHAYLPPPRRPAAEERPTPSAFLLPRSVHGRGPGADAAQPL